MLRHVIIGSGVAGVCAADEIRRRDPDSRITIFNAEPYPYYFRPALSFYFKGAISEEELLGKPPFWAKENRIKLLADRAASIRLEDREVTGASGIVEPYDRLLIATGGSPFMAPWPGADLEGVFTYRGIVCARTKMDYVRKRRCKKAVVIGGGILGVEMVENLQNLGIETTLLVRDDRILKLLLDEAGSRIVHDEMESDGVRIMLKTEAAEMVGENGRVREVKLKSGQAIPADIVIAAIGSRPDADLANEAGIETDGGVVVDGFMRTSAEDVYAAGDVAVRKADGQKTPCRTWLVAGEMGKTAGANMAGAGVEFEEKTFLNASHAYKTMYAVVGRFSEPEGDGVRHVVLDSPPGAHAKVILENNRVIGGVFVGETTPALRVYRAIERGAEMDPGVGGRAASGALSAAAPSPYIVF